MNENQSTKTPVPNQPNCEPEEPVRKPSPNAGDDPNHQKNDVIMSDPNLYSDFQTKSSSLASSTRDDPQISMDEKNPKSKNSPAVTIVGVIVLLGMITLGYFFLK